MILELGVGLLLAAQAGADVRNDLEQIEQRLAATWKAGDCAGWGALLAAEWSVIHITGNVITKAEALEMCRTPRPPDFDMTIDEVSIRVFGDAAVVTGRTRATTGGAGSVTLTIRFTDVFVRRDGRWQVVASQATRLGS